MALLIDFDEVEAEGLIDWKEIIDLTEKALGDLGAYGEQVNHPRRRLHCPSLTRISLHAGAAMSYGLLGMMIHSELPVVSAEGKALPAQVVKGRGDYIYVLYEAETAKLAAIVRRRRDQRGVDYRTAATSAVGTRRLMRQGSCNLALFGSSHQARSHLHAFSCIMNLKRVRVFSPNPEHRKSFCREMESALSLVIEPVESPAAALADADVVLEASNTTIPVFPGRMLQPGMHVTSIAGSNRELAAQQGVVRRGVDEETIRESAVILVNIKEQTRQDRQGEIFQAVGRGDLSWERIEEIGALVAGKTSGRTNDSQITFYNNNAGMGVVDVSLAAHVYRLAKAHGLAREL
jgi:ornithine cyclodeaminase/alanine dehydrogenase-like protein (mu-crystallin family)